MNNNHALAFVRYTPGACGNFLISMLQLSSRMAHWDPGVQMAKAGPDFVEVVEKWFYQRFTAHNDQHLKYEPHHPYALDFFSSKHHRGDDLSLQEFLAHLRQRQDIWFERWADQGLVNLLRLNKTVVPRFGWNSTIVNIRTDPTARRWLNRCRAVKLFGREHGAWISKENHPEYLAAKFRTTQFHNQYRWNLSDHAFIRRHIIEDPVVQLMQDPSLTLEHHSNAHCEQIWVDLSDLLIEERFLPTLHRLYRTMDLGTFDSDLVTRCYQHYHATNIRPFLARACQR